MWNRRCLQPPPECKLKVTLSDSNLEALTALKTQIQKVKPVILDQMKLLTAEHYILKRIVYKLINQMRRDKALSCLRQVSSCIKRLADLNVETMVETLEEYFNIDPSQIIQEEYLPSIQMLQYRLVRLTGLGSLLAQTSCYCCRAYTIIKQYLGLGNLVQHYLVMMAISARIWYVCRSMCTHICELYNGLYSCRDILQATQVKWLPDTEELPDDLAIWVQEQFHEVTLPVIKSEMSETATKQLENHMESGWNMHCSEDLGVPVKRPGSEEIITATSQAEDDANNNKRRTKRKKITESRNPDNKKTGRSDITATEISGNLHKARVQRLKKGLKLLLKSVNDIQDLENKLRDKEVVQVGNESICVTQLGRKKILKKVRTLKTAISVEEREDVKEGQLLKKVRVALARLLVKFDESAEITDDVKVSITKKGKKKKTQKRSEDANNSENTLKVTVLSKKASADNAKKKKVKSKSKKEKTETAVKQKTKLKTNKAEKKVKPVKKKKPIQNIKASHQNTVKNKKKKKRKM